MLEEFGGEPALYCTVNHVFADAHIPLRFVENGEYVVIVIFDGIKPVGLLLERLEHDFAACKLEVFKQLNGIQMFGKLQER